MKKYYLILLLIIILISCQKKQESNDDIVFDEDGFFKELEANRIENTAYITPVNTQPVNTEPVYRNLPTHKVYNFKPGYYYMLDYPVRIRSQPNLQGEVIGTLGMNSKINIISIANNESALEIDGVGALWYEIEYENIKGYIWGGYISAKTLVYDIDNNGVDDYFHYRVSKIQGPHFYYVNALNDIVIYLNNKKIQTTDIGKIKSSCGECYFEISEKNTVLIIMYFGAGGEIWEDTFEMNETGNIVLINQFYENVSDSDY